MKIPLKTLQEIKVMQAGGKRLVKVLKLVLESAQLGVSLKKLDELADDLIKKEGGKSSFKMVRNYHWATCLSINQGVVHGIPGRYQLKNKDLLSVDVGMWYQGFHTDMAWTVEIQGTKYKVRSKTDKFLDVGKAALKKAIAAAKLGNRVGDISLAIEKTIKISDFSPIECLTGHGVGKKLHEEPAIPCFLKGKIEKTTKLKPGMVLAIEVIYSQGKPEIILRDDGWTIETADGLPAALFEKTVAVTLKGPLVLTPLNKKALIN